jgi:hypothetical protein
MNSANRANFLKKIHKFSMYEARLFCMTAPHEYELMIANDYSEAQLLISNQFHSPYLTGMKAMYMKSKSLYSEFKKTK